MKRSIIALIFAGLSFSCVPEKMEKTELENTNEEIRVNSRLEIPPGFSFESTALVYTSIQLDNSFQNENVKIKLYQISFNGEEQMIYDGFINTNKALTDAFKIPNHIQGIKIMATWNGVVKKVSTSKTAIATSFSKTDFTGSKNSSQFSDKDDDDDDDDDYTFCEDGGKEGSVEIYERVLVIKGSNKKDEVDVDKNGSKTKVELKTDGKKRVDTEFNNSDFDCIFIYTYNGDDKVDMGSTEKPSLINLGNGKDEAKASDEAKDIIYGGEGKDKITGKFASDELIGGEGKDDIDNGSGGTITEDGDDESCTPTCYSTDKDGDGYESIENGGVDVDDNNPNVVSRNYPQGQGVFYSLIFEDLWPCQGDYDFNDLIVNYSFDEGRNGNDEITEFDFSFKVPALGGALNNFAVLRVMDTDNDASLTRSDSENITVERVHDATNQTTLFYFENLKSFYTSNEAAIVNTREMSYNSILQLTGTIDGVDGAYDIYMLKDGDETAEVHPNVIDGISGPSSFFNSSLSGCHEGSVVDFKTDEGFPWGMVVPIEWQWPKEGIDILEAFPDFRTFVETNPSIDWYSSNNPTRDLSKIIQ